MTSLRTERVALDTGAMDMHVWTPASGHGPGILLIQEIFGVGAYIRAVAERLADAGYVVGAPDVFWRFEPNWESEHSPAGLDASLAMVGQLDFPSAIADCVGALDHLARLPETDAQPGVLGFCMGGSLAWGVAAQGSPSCCVSYYGSGVASMVGMIDAIACPTLLHFGSDDAYIPMTDVERINTAIAGHDGFILNVEDGGHAFDNHESEFFFNESAARSAWAKTMAFLATHLGGL